MKKALFHTLTESEIANLKTFIPTYSFASHVATINNKECFVLWSNDEDKDEKFLDMEIAKQMFSLKATTKQDLWDEFEEYCKNKYFTFEKGVLHSYVK